MFDILDEYIKEKTIEWTQEMFGGLFDFVTSMIIIEEPIDEIFPIWFDRPIEFIALSIVLFIIFSLKTYILRVAGDQSMTVGEFSVRAIKGLVLSLFYPSFLTYTGLKIGFIGVKILESIFSFNNAGGGIELRYELYLNNWLVFFVENLMLMALVLIICIFYFFKISFASGSRIYDLITLMLFSLVAAPRYVEDSTMLRTVNNEFIINHLQAIFMLVYMTISFYFLGLSVNWLHIILGITGLKYCSNANEQVRKYYLDITDNGASHGSMLQALSQATMISGRFG